MAGDPGRARPRLAMSMDDEFRKYEIGGAYHWTWYQVDYAGYRRFVDRIEALLPTQGSLLDVGCGDGLMSYRFFRRGLLVTGIDNNSRAIELARKVCGETVLHSPGLGLRAKLGELQFACRGVEEIDEDRAYDVAVCAEVIEHVERPAELVAMLRRAVRHYAIITTPDGTGQEPGPYDHNLWTPESFGDFLAGYRFEPLDLRPGTIAVKLLVD